MIRACAISLIGVLMAGQLILLLCRDSPYNSKDYPYMSLPVASKYSRGCCYGIVYTSISWTQKDGWVVSGKGHLRDEDLDTFLRSETEKHLANGGAPGMRVRIPANAPAGIFLNLTKRMKQAGMEHVRVVVVNKRYPGF